MDLYSLMRQFADSWALLALVLIFLGVALWVFRPGTEKLHEDAAESIFRHDRRPAPLQPEKESP